MTQVVKPKNRIVPQQNGEGSIPGTGAGTMVPAGSRAEGNTHNPPPNRVAPRINHFFTWFATLEEVVPMVPGFQKLAKRGIIQSETCPTTGKLHFHGVLECNEKIRDSAFKAPKQVHWEKVIDLEASRKYCRKGREDWPSKAVLPATEPGDYNGLFCVEWGHQVLNLIRPDRPYQKQILDIISGVPDERKIYWFYEEVGGVGKSSLVKFIYAKHKALFISEGKKSDLINIIYNADMTETNIVLVDVPRANKNNVSYKALEEIKNGMICNTKYETGMKLFNSPHIIIFSNFYPEVKQLSIDRWEIYKILPDYTTELEEPTWCEEGPPDPNPNWVRETVRH